MSDPLNDFTQQDADLGPEGIDVTHSSEDLVSPERGDDDTDRAAEQEDGE